jgi:tetratricopeptide (TPR) repeat protein
MPNVSTRQTSPIQLKAQNQPQHAGHWLLAGLTALQKDVTTYTVMALGLILNKLNLAEAANQTYAWGSKHNPMFFHLLGDSVKDTDPEQALHYYQQALNTLANPSEQPNLLKKLAQVHSTQKEWAQAAICLETVLQTHPNDFDCMFHMAEVGILMHDWFKAMYYCKEGLNHDPRNPVLWGHLGYAMYRLEDTEGSVKAYQTALQFGRDDTWKSQVAQTLGQLTYQQTSHTTDAVGYFKQAIQLNPKNADALEMMAEIALKQNHIQDALEAYNQLLSLTPGRSDIYCALGYVLWQLDRNQEAVDAYLAAIHLDAHNAVALNNLGVIYLDEELMPLKALTLFEQAFAINPLYTLARFNAGRCHEMLGQTQQAAHAYSQAHQLNVDQPELDMQEIDERLKKLFILDC